MVLNKSLQASFDHVTREVEALLADCSSGDKHSKHECRTCCSNVQELSIERSVSFRRCETLDKSETLALTVL